MTLTIWQIALVALVAALAGASPSIWRAWRNRPRQFPVTKIMPDAVTAEEREDRRTVMVVWEPDTGPRRTLYVGPDQVVAKKFFYDPDKTGLFMYFVGADCRGRRRVWPDGRVAREA